MLVGLATHRVPAGDVVRDRNGSPDVCRNVGSAKTKRCEMGGDRLPDLPLKGVFAEVRMTGCDDAQLFFGRGRKVRLDFLIRLDRVEAVDDVVVDNDNALGLFDRCIRAMEELGLSVLRYLVKGGLQCDAPPDLSSAPVSSSIPHEKEIGREEAFFRRADHWFPA